MTQCIACNTCMHLIFKAKPIECLMNPEAGKEWQPEKPAVKKKKLLIIGDSPACLEAARVAAVKGHEVAVWNARGKWEGHWSWLIRPVIAQKKRVLSKLGVELQLGKEILFSEIDKLQPDAILVAQALIAIRPGFPGIEEVRVVTPEEALSGHQIPDNKVVILGGNNVGYEVAACLKARNKELDVTIIEEKERTGTGIEPFTRRMVQSKLLEKRGVEIISGAKCLKYENNKLFYQIRGKEIEEIEARYIISALGYETKETLKEDLHRKGCEVHSLPACYKPAEAMEAMNEAAKIVRNLS